MGPLQPWHLSSASCQRRSGLLHSVQALPGALLSLHPRAKPGLNQKFHVIIDANTSSVCYASTKALRSRQQMTYRRVPVGPPSRGWDVRVCVFWYKPTELAHSFLFCSWRLFLSSLPFQLYFFAQILPITLRFLICSSSLISAFVKMYAFLFSS